MISFFLLFCIVIICFYCIIILTINPIYSVLNLILVINGFSVLLFNLECEFLPYILLIVYVGAVLILFLFLIMMININSYYVKKEKNIIYFYVVFFF
jgi:NADH-quinone oxidoreductase subunit J